MGPGRRQLRSGSNPGPVAVGARYRLGVRMGGRVASDGLRGHRVRAVPAGRPGRVAGSGVDAVDDIEFTATDAGTRIDYTADIRLVGPAAARGARSRAARSTGVGRRAREGMRVALDRLAAGA